jgi:hypothetical protein
MGARAATDDAALGTTAGVAWMRALADVVRIGAIAAVGATDGCGGSSAAEGANADAAPAVLDAGASVEAGPALPHPGWAMYTIAPGAHPATVTQNGAPALPIAGFTSVSSRTFEFIFDPSAAYVLTSPTDPTDQLDWNKLPGLSDCGLLDLSKDGFMFVWRWRLDRTPHALELGAYANNAGKHLTAPETVFLDADDLAAEQPLSYTMAIGGAGDAEYVFRLSGTIRGRPVALNATLPRRCAGAPTGTSKWGAGFYFGGTSVAPSTITGFIREAR